jgi:hypothetical protein
MIPNAILEYAVSHPEQLGALLTGLAGSLVHYRRTGRVPIGRLPYRAARQVFRDYVVVAGELLPDHILESQEVRTWL